MSNNYYQDNPDIQNYLNLTQKIEESAESAGTDMSNSVYFNSANFALTWVLTSKVIPSALRLTTMQSYAAYYGIMFVGEFISEMLERNGQGNVASYFGNDYDDMEIQWDDSPYIDDWIEDAGESLVQATYDTLMGIKATIDFVIDGTLNLAGLVESSDRLPMLTYDEKKEGTWRELWADEYIFREGGGNDYLDMDKRNHNGRGNRLTVYGGGGQDYIANVSKAYGEDNND